MSLDREQKVRGNLIPEGLVAPHGVAWPPDPADGQLYWHLPEQKMYVYDLNADSWIPVSIEQQVHFEPVIQDLSYLWGLSFAAVRAGAFFSKWRNKNLIHSIAPASDYDALWRYTYWQFALQTTNTWTTPTRFPTENDFYTFLESYVPSSGNVYYSGLQFRALDAVDDSDPYPSKVRHRNSLLASMKGVKSWVRGARAGVDSKFNQPTWYINFYNEVGQRFIQQSPGGAPLTNDDGVVWYHRGSVGTLWRWPLVNGSEGSGSIAVGSGQRASAWDNVANTYVSPAPAGNYITQAPFFMVEHNPHSLSLVDANGPQQRARELWFPMVLVFPVVLYDGPTPRYYGYIVVPHGADSFITDNVDTGNYDFFACCKYRHTYRKIYIGPIDPAVFSDEEHSLFKMSHIPFSVRTSTGSKLSIDRDSTPVQVDVFRRNRFTGARSNFFTAYNVVRRINHASYRVDPAPWKK